MKITFEIERITYTWCDGMLYDSVTDAKEPMPYEEIDRHLRILRKYTGIEDNIKYSES